MNSFSQPLIILCLVMFFSCKKDVKPIEDHSVSINFDYNEKGYHSPFSTIKDIKVIYLETTEASTFVNVDKVLVHSDRIYFQDFDEDIVTSFESNGSFIQRVGSKGKGPGEYREARDISINRSLSEIYLLDYRRVHVFDLNSLNFKKTIDINFENQSIYNPMSFCNVGENQFLFWVTSPDAYNPEELESYNLIQYDHGNYDYYYPYVGNIDVISIRFTTSQDGQCLIRPPYGDFRIMEWKDGKPEFKYNFTTPAPIPQSMIKDKPNIDKRAIYKSNYDKMITKVFETDNHIYISINGSSERYEGIYNKSEKSWVSGPGVSHPDFPKIIYADSDAFYGYLYPYKIIERIKEKEKHEEFNSTFYDKLEIEKLDDSMNPVVFKMSFN